MLLSIHIAKLGETFTRDTDTLPAGTLAYLFRNGYSQRMRDCHADVKRGDYAEGDAGKAAWQADVRKAIDKVLLQFDSGECPPPRGDESTATTRTRKVVAMAGAADWTDAEAAAAREFITAQRAQAESEAA